MRRFVPAVVCLLVLAFAASPALAQQWESYSSEKHNIKFSVPGKWKTTSGTNPNGVPFLESESPDGSLYLMVYAYTDSSLSTEDLLDKAVDDLGLKLTGEANEEEINGLHAWVAEATGRIDGQPVGLFIMAATYDEHNYVAYVFTEQSKFDKNADVMNKILDSFAPIRK